MGPLWNIEGTFAAGTTMVHLENMRALHQTTRILPLTGALWLGCSDNSATPRALAIPQATAGYTEYATRLSIPIGNGLLKNCHAIAVAPQRVLTAAHCFSEVSEGARGYLEDFNRSFSMKNVEFHPGAFRGSTQAPRDLWDESDIVVSFDLALISLNGPLPGYFPLLPNRETTELALEASSFLAEFSRQGAERMPETAFALVGEEVPAAQLVGPEHEGLLLSAESSGVYPGSSGAGVLVRTGGSSDTHVLLGVIQNANPDDPSLSFGIVPLYNPTTLQWLQPNEYN